MLLSTVLRSGNPTIFILIFFTFVRKSETEFEQALLFQIQTVCVGQAVGFEWLEWLFSSSAWLFPKWRSNFNAKKKRTIREHFAQSPPTLTNTDAAIHFFFFSVLSTLIKRKKRKKTSPLNSFSHIPLSGCSCFCDERACVQVGELPSAGCFSKCLLF